MNTQKKVQQFLAEFEFPTKLNGYFYFKDCLCLILEENNLPQNKELWAILAQKYSTDADNIERCLQTLVDKMWAAVGLWTQKPSVREFIMKSAEYIAHASRRERSVYDILFRKD